MSKKNKNSKSELEQSFEALGKQIIEKSRDLAKRLPVLGHVSWLYSQVDTHKHFSFNEVNTRIMPALMLEQCKLYLQAKTGGVPMAFVSWAFLDEEAEQRFSNTMKLLPKDWKSGDSIWLIDFITPFGGQDKIIQELRHKIFPDKNIHLLLPSHNGGFSKVSIDDLLDMKLSSEDESDESKTDKSKSDKSRQH